MRVRILGSGAGGGFPQWNCGCHQCTAFRQGTFPGAARTQTSVALSRDGESWYLLQASPEVRAQIESYPPLFPRSLRDTPIAGVFLTNGDLDACLGLLSLRESQPLRIFATAAVRRSFAEGNKLHRTLERFPGQVTWRALEVGASFLLDEHLEVEVIAVPGKVPLHVADLEDPSEEDNVALRFVDRSTGVSMLFAPTVLRATSLLEAAALASDLVLFDGTFWTSDELTAQGMGKRRAEDMGHWPISGPGGSLELLAQCRGQVFFVHVNNTNPILRDDGPERHQLASRGVAVAYDGMEWTR